MAQGHLAGQTVESPGEASRDSSRRQTSTQRLSLPQSDPRVNNHRDSRLLTLHAIRMHSRGRQFLGAAALDVGFPGQAIQEWSSSSVGGHVGRD